MSSYQPCRCEPADPDEIARLVGKSAKGRAASLEAVQRAAKLCASLGHVVEEADPELDMVALRPMNARISATNTARLCNMRWKALGREPSAADVEAATWAVYQRGLKVSGVEYVEAIAAAHAAGRKMAAFLTSCDVILSTTLAGPPTKLGYFEPGSAPRRRVKLIRTRCASWSRRRQMDWRQRLVRSPNRPRSSI